MRFFHCERSNNIKPVGVDEQAMLQEHRQLRHLKRYRAQLFCMRNRDGQGASTDCSEACRCPIIQNRWFVETKAADFDQAIGQLRSDLEQSSINAARKLKPTLTRVNGTTIRRTQPKSCPVGMDEPTVR